MKQLNISTGLLFGLIYGLATVLFFIILYILGVNSFMSSFTAIFSIGVPIAAGVWGGIYHKKSLGGYMDFSEALKTIFTIFVIGSAISTGFQYVLLNFIDVPFAQALAQASAEKAAEMMEKFGAKQSDIDKSVEEILSGDSYSFKKQFLGFALGTIWWFLLSLIISAILKKKKPAFENPFNQ